MQDSFSMIVWRDSVCAGDDGDAPHAWVLRMSRDTSLRDLIKVCLERRYLASISGGKATWILEATRPLAVIAQQWVEPRYLVAPATPIFSLIDVAANPHLHFRYRCQTDPDQVFASLSRGEPFSAL